MKKLISLLLSMTFVVSVLSAIPMNSYAEDATEETAVEATEASENIITVDVVEILGAEYSEDIIAEVEEEYESLVKTYGESLDSDINPETGVLYEDGEERYILDFSVSKETLVACIELSAFVKERKAEDPDVYKYITSCGLDYDYDTSSVIVRIGGNCSFGDGKAIAEIKAFMEENDIDGDLVSMSATEEWIVVETTELITEIETLDEIFEENSDTEVTAVEYGDVNGDKTISISDAVLLNKYLVGSADISEDNETTADVNIDGTVDASDASLVLGYCVQAVESLPYTE